MKDQIFSAREPHGLEELRTYGEGFAGDEPGCQEDLDEAWEIAERGPMPLFQADILLYRARLFHDRTARLPPPGRRAGGCRSCRRTLGYQGTVHAEID